MRNATTDYEKAIKNALLKEYPGITLISCWFHFCQALAKYAKKIKGFRKFVKDVDAALRLYHKLLCLPLMRADNIRTAFKLLKEEALKLKKNYLHTIPELHRTSNNGKVQNLFPCIWNPNGRTIPWNLITQR